MKKLLVIISVITVLFILPVSAANVGDKISEAVYTDIVAYVNNYPMPAYVVDGYAVIVAEDLRDYCCDVVYDEVTRSLYITKAGEDATFSNKLVYKPNRETGEYYTDVLYTDIKTYVNGNEVKSFNVNGKTMIVIDEFGKNMDGYEWDNVNRAAFSYLADKPMAEFKPVDKRIEVLFDDNGAHIGSYDSDRYTRTYTGAYDFDFDGIEEDIFVEEICTWDAGVDSSYRITIKIGEYIKILPDRTNLGKIMLCDMDLTDGVKDLMLFFASEGGRTVEIFRYAESLPNYRFGYEGQKVGWISTATYGIVQPKMEFLDENSFSFRMSSTLEYPILRIYEKSNTDDMFYPEKNVPYWEIDREFVIERSKYIHFNNTYEEEMWKQGYIKAYCDHNGEFISIKEGEYFKVLYDNGNSYVFIEKLNGESGWIYIGGRGYMLNFDFFRPFG
ncbi:MAG: hypothetical protein Q4G23_01445 [Clostridia bacterium]|nr:hypothetical protein [Clostridia bacterium]